MLDKIRRSENESAFVQGEVDGKTFATDLAAVYSEVVHWQRNVFMIPSGSVGKHFVREIRRLLHCFNQRSALESIVLCAVMSMPHLLLQKP